MVLFTLQDCLLLWGMPAPRVYWADTACPPPPKKGGLLHFYAFYTLLYTSKMSHHRAMHRWTLCSQSTGLETVSFQTNTDPASQISLLQNFPWIMWVLIYMKLLKYTTHIKWEFPIREKKMKLEKTVVNKMHSMKSILLSGDELQFWHWAF